MGREILGLHGFPSEFKPLKGGEKVYLPGSDITKKKKLPKATSTHQLKVWKPKPQPDIA